MLGMKEELNQLLLQYEPRRYWLKRFSANLKLFLMLLAMVSFMVTYVVLVALFNVTAVIAVSVTVIHLSIAVMVFFGDIIKVLLRVCVTKYIVTDVGYFTVKAIVQLDADNSIRLELHPFGDTKETVSLTTKETLLFGRYVVPERYPVLSCMVALV